MNWNSSQQQPGGAADEPEDLQGDPTPAIHEGDGRSDARQQGQIHQQAAARRQQVCMQQVCSRQVCMQQIRRHEIRLQEQGREDAHAIGGHVLQEPGHGGEHGGAPQRRLQQLAPVGWIAARNSSVRRSRQDQPRSVE